jgi:2-polyprenyl-6-methoxyphenol hydroxylase-like FAD-dependent oxidoreductase
VERLAALVRVRSERGSIWLVSGGSFQNGDMIDTSRDHAVVIGAGIGGLLAAVALQHTYPRITVIDRDVLPDGPTYRQGVPQSRQVHAMLARGLQEIESLLPGFVDELGEAGAPFGDPLRDMHWYINGHQLMPADSGILGVGASRPLVEYVLRRRVEALPGVQILPTHDVVGLTTNADGKRVTGVRVISRADHSAVSVLDAGLVVDASGRGGRAPFWLTEIGYRVPEPERLRVDVVNIARHYRRAPGDLDGRIGTSVNYYPGHLHGGFALAQEGDRFAVVVGGMLGADPPMDHDGMLDWVKPLDSQDIYDIMRDAEPLDEPAKIRFKANVRYRYEDLTRFPDAYLVIGDAMCSFNPIYGQGMSVAAVEATLLRDLVSKGSDELSGQFFREAAKAIDTPWTVAVGNDLRFPEAVGFRPADHDAINKYMERFHAAAASDPELSKAFIKVMNMIEPPSSLFGRLG